MLGLFAVSEAMGENTELAINKGKNAGSILPSRIGLSTHKIFVIKRDPFQRPTEMLPTECPPSFPLCRLNRSQLKVVGIVQVADGAYKGMVEDPDGRGYFLIAGMQVNGSTVTQVSQKGILLRDHNTGRNIMMRLYVEPEI